ncbi:aspartate racemase [Desulfuromusa kysingii]|uniref:Aspartate racemase n=1 Tax=Desulfuromusa kysingii TaxID=37625 RepID=A0A1H4DZ50_9BACT|nr:amino acid racemase [Desulfuromusa kysingii]SEA77630.1 aspartate racemase [Desulfuromusa kysingii]
MGKKIGIIGGLSPESTASYYLHITRSFVEMFGTYSYPEIIIYSVNLENYHQWRAANRWDLIAADMITIAEKLQTAGADFGLIATNTMHKVFDVVQQAIDLPLLHLIDATVEAIKAKNLATIGLLGTKYTMTDGFYTDRLDNNNLTTVVPVAEDQEIIHRIIVEELVRGQFLESSKRQYLSIIDKMKKNGAEGIILGCTEIPLLVHQDDCDIPLFDTAVIHAEAALKTALA